MNNTRKTKVTIKHSDGSKLQLSAKPDTSLEDWLVHFETIMSFLGFVPAEIEEAGEAMKDAYMPEVGDVISFPDRGGVEVVDVEDPDGHPGIPC